MDILRCKTPDMVIEEIVMHMMVYNCIRQLMFESAERFGAELRRVSFKGSVQAIRQRKFLPLSSKVSCLVKFSVRCLWRDWVVENLNIIKQQLSLKSIQSIDFSTTK